jgi:hypothetical protein
VPLRHLHLNPTLHPGVIMCVREGLGSRCEVRARSTPGRSPEGRPSVKAKLASLVLSALIIACFASIAAAKTPSTAVPDPGIVDSNVAERAPSLAMDIMPFDHVARTPSLAMDIMPSDYVARAPSLAMDIGPINVLSKTPSLHVPQPLQVEHMAKAPSVAVPEPLQVECNGPTMTLTLKTQATVEVAIYSVNGRLVRRISEVMCSGESSLTWDGRDDGGARAASGVYFARVKAEEDTGKGKLVLVR